MVWSTVIGTPGRAGIEHDDLRRFVAFILSVVPLVDQLNDGISCGEMECAAVVGHDRQFSLQQDARVDDRMFMHRQPGLRPQGDPEDGDFRLPIGVLRQRGPVPA